MQERLLFFPLDLIYLGTTVSCVQYHHHHHHLLTVNNNNNLVTYSLFLCFSYRRSLVKRKENKTTCVQSQPLHARNLTVPVWNHTPHRGRTPNGQVRRAVLVVVGDNEKGPKPHRGSIRMA